jgi:uncharacterized protein
MIRLGHSRVVVGGHRGHSPRRLDGLQESMAHRMGAGFVIIDGYNLLHAAGYARVRYAPGDLQRAREQLLGGLVMKLPSAERKRCTVVFDAQDAPLTATRAWEHRELTVLFAPPGADADGVIEELVRKHPAPRQLVVVSSDHRVQKAATKRGARAVDSEPYWEQLQSRIDERLLPADGTMPADRSSKTPARSAGTSGADAWLREFGTVSIEELSAAVDAEQPPPPEDGWQKHVTHLQSLLDSPDQTERWLKDTTAASQTTPGKGTARGNRPGAVPES